MKVKQLSIFLENQSGRLAEVAEILGTQGINIRALSLADTSGFGVLRLIVNDLAAARRALQAHGFTLRETDVIAAEVPDRPGGLASVLGAFGAGGINIEYMYAFVEKRSQAAIVIFRVENPDVAIRALQERGVRLLAAEEVSAL